MTLQHLCFHCLHNNTFLCILWIIILVKMESLAIFIYIYKPLKLIIFSVKHAHFLTGSQNTHVSLVYLKFCKNKEYGLYFIVETYHKCMKM